MREEVEEVVKYVFLLELELRPLLAPDTTDTEVITLFSLLFKNW